MSYNCRLLPNEPDLAMLNQHCGDSRFVWNLALAHNDMHVTFGSYPKLYDGFAELTNARKSTFLSIGSAVIQQQALRDLHQAFQNWWKNPKHFGRPTLRKRDKVHSFRIVDLKWRQINHKYGQIQVPKIGWIKFRWTYAWAKLNDVKSARIKLRKDGKWIVSFTAPQDPVPSVGDNVIGIDLGVANTIALNDGRTFQVPQGLTPAEQKRKRKLERSRARSIKGSNRRKKTQLKLNRLSQRATDRKKDWIEKTTTDLVAESSFIALEDLNIAKMLQRSKSRRLNRTMSESCLGLIRLRIEQKALASGVQTIRVNPAYTSQVCNQCGHVSSKNRESQARFVCKMCLYSRNADVNAAMNILDRALVDIIDSGEVPAVGHTVAGQGGSLRRGVKPVHGPLNCQPLETIVPW